MFYFVEDVGKIEARRKIENNSYPGVKGAS